MNVLPTPIDQPFHECILWMGAVNSGGYPVTWDGGKTVYAHRLAAKAKEGDVVMHTCDTPRCINPDHLRIGTAAENSQDMVNKRRQAYGEACPRAKLREEQVQLIRELKGVKSSRAVASMFDISKTNVLDIWNGRIWKYT